MNHKFVPVVAAILIIGIMLSSTPLAAGQVTTLAFGPKLEVVTIPQDNQKLKTGVIVLGLAGTGTDLMSQHKIIVTYNGGLLMWRVGDPEPLVFCNTLEKDKVNVIPDPKDGIGPQYSVENLMTKLVDVSTEFICKVRWTSPAPGWLESKGVLDVYFIGTAKPVWISDNILAVEAVMAVGKTVVVGSDIQDICVLGYAVSGSTAALTDADDATSFSKPDGSLHYIFANAMGNFVSCEQLALVERDALGLPIPTGQDPAATEPLAA